MGRRLRGGLPKISPRITISVAISSAFAPSANRRPSTIAERDTGARAAGAELRRAGIRVPETEAEALETQRIHADGAVSMDVPMSLMNSLVAERDAEGRLVVRHGKAGHAHDASAPAVEVADE